MPGTKTTKKEITKNLQGRVFTLILWNDDVNSFDDVIDALVEICEHDPHQAEQCATIAHYRGKCDIKSDPSFDTLMSFKRLFDARQISTTIE